MIPCRRETSKVCTHWGVLKFFIARGMVLNLTIIVFVDLPFLWKRIGRGFWVESKLNYQTFNISMTIVDFLRHGKFAVRGVVLNLTAMISN